MRRVRVEAMDLVEVDVVGPEPPQGCVDPGQNVLARQTSVVGPVPHRAEDLGGEHVVVAARERPRQQPAGDLLADTHRVHVGGVEEGHAGLDRRAHDRLRIVLTEEPLTAVRVAIGHHAQADA